MRVGGKPAALGEFLAEMLEVLFVQPAFQKSAGINSRRSVSLKINNVPGKIAMTRAKKIVERDLVQGCGGGKGGDMAAQSIVDGVGIDDHGHGVPADVALDANLGLPVAGIIRLFFDGNGVDVGRADKMR